LLLYLKKYNTMGEYPKKDNHPIVIIAYNYEKQGEIS
jgi:hypothetical protein